jgi:phosphoserine phosphatase RsbU/P
MHPRDPLGEGDLLACQHADLVGRLIQGTLASREDRRSAACGRLKAELQILRQSQPPQEFLSAAAGGWCSIGGRIRNAREVGGDFCECIPLSRRLILLGVGDAAGNSIPAAMIAAMTRAAMKAIAQSGEHREFRPERILASLNRTLLGLMASHQFVTLTLGLLDGTRSLLTLATAGHPPPVIFRNDETHQLIVPGLPLGVSTEAAYQSREFPLHCGDLIAFYSDGLISGYNGLSSFSGLLREVRVSEGMPGKCIVPLVERMWNSLENSPDHKPTDDRSLMLVRFENAAVDSFIRPIPAATPHRPRKAVS